MQKKFRSPVTLFVVSGVIIVGSVLWNGAATESYKKAYWSSGRTGSEENAKQQVQISRVLTYAGGVGAAAGLMWVVIAAASKTE